jgi:nucleoside phosphorylase
MVLNPAEFQIIWITPLPIEHAAALHLLDQRYDDSFPIDQGDNYIFTGGRMCGHNVAIATLPPGTISSTAQAAALTAHVEMFFSSPWLVFIVGVASGIPNLEGGRDIRLGDVLVASSDGDVPAIVPYGFGKETEDGWVQLRGGWTLQQPKILLMSAVSKAQYTPISSPTHFLNILKEINPKHFPAPGADEDILYDANHNVVTRPQRTKERTKAWIEPIGSGDMLVRSAKKRDELRDTFKIMGLEMAAAGTNTVVPAVVVRGVCDYADHGDNEKWEAFAAAKAAAYAKGILMHMPPVEEMGGKQQGGLLHQVCLISWCCEWELSGLYVYREMRRRMLGMGSR